MNNSELKEMRQNITALIDDIKYHSDSLTDIDRLPVIQLKVILAKINKLNEKTTILLHYVEKQGKLSDKIFEEVPVENLEQYIESITPPSEEIKEDIQVEKTIEVEKVENIEKPKSSAKAIDVQEKFKKLKVHDLNSAIGINEKYLFASELFKGSIDQFSKALKDINEMKEASELSVYLDGLKEIYSWDLEKETTKNFIDLLERKFDQL